jgi:hypothetical protein
MVSMVVSSVVDHGFHPRSSQTKDFVICICCFCAKHNIKKDKDWLAWNRDNVEPHVYCCFSELAL